MKKTLTALAMAGAFLMVTGSPAFAYEVKTGDTMTEIANEHGMTLGELSAMNPTIHNIDLILVGQNVNTNKNEKVSTKVEVSTNSNVGASNYEVDLMARLVRAEASGESYAGKLAVASVILNRVDSPMFPNSIHGVVYEAGQFSPVTNGSINLPADSESRRAVIEALNGNRSVSAGTLYFYNPATASSRWLDSKETTAVIGNHVFK